jgi:tryptophan synthase alpha chain
MNPVDALFQRLRAEGRKAFIPFVTAGDPDLEATAHLIEHLPECSADLIEIGFPYSDPIADGPIIQASYTRALGRGVRTEAIFQRLEQVRRSPVWKHSSTPLVGMVSYALVQRRGHSAFLERAQAAGLNGLIVPDLPVDESAELRELAAARDFKLIHLVTPTTPRDRAVAIARASTGFLYYVSVTGITGERDGLPEQLLSQLEWLRGQTTVPICVGFGISKPEHVRLLREAVDGIIVGSALVRRLEEGTSRPIGEVTEEIGQLVRTLAGALNPPPEESG